MSDTTHINPSHPYGVTLLARDTPENRATWGADNLGYVDIDPSICSPQCPHYHYTKDKVNKESSNEETPIHLLIASFRDRLCPRTLHNVWSRAKHPHRIFIRLVDQTLPDSELIDDAPCWEQYCQVYNRNCEEDFGKNIYVFHMDASLSKGPTDARSKLSAMIAHDYRQGIKSSSTEGAPTSSPLLSPVQLHDFCMQTDSHMDFSDHWDTRLVAMFHRTQNDYAVLSTYVTDISSNNQDSRVVPNLCMVTFTSTIRNWGTKECKWLQTPKLTNAMWGAGLSFHRCHAEINVPVDPYLTNVFDGEEGSRGIRFFTHGYDVYTPDRVLVTHDYHGHQSNPIVHTWGGGKKGRDALAEGIPNFLLESEAQRHRVSVTGTKRVNMLLGIDEPVHPTPEQQRDIDLIRNSRYGLGKKRNLQQVREFTGINLRERRMEENKCGNLKWVPFEESPDYGVGETLSRGLAGEAVPQFLVPHSEYGTIARSQQLLRAARSLEEQTLAKLPVNDTSVLGIGLGSLAVLAIIIKVSSLRSRRKKSRFD